MTAAEVADTIMADSDESDMENEKMMISTMMQSLYLMNQQLIKLLIKTLTLDKLITIHQTVMQRLVQLMVTIRKMRLLQISTLSQPSGTLKNKGS